MLYPLQTKIVVHIDALGSADKIPFGVGAPPFGIIRLQPLAGGVCRYKVSSSDPSDPGEEDIVQTARVPSRIVLTSMLPCFFAGLILITRSPPIRLVRIPNRKELGTVNTNCTV
jgi:hypothetical protein